jgi:hypothetical protein
MLPVRSKLSEMVTVWLTIRSSEGLGVPQSQVSFAVVTQLDPYKQGNAPQEDMAISNNNISLEMRFNEKVTLYALKILILTCIP